MQLILDVPKGAAAGDRRTRRAIVTVTTRGGGKFTERVDACPGLRFNPMTWHPLSQKAHAVLDALMAPQRVDELVTSVRNLETLPSVRQLRPLLIGPVSGVPESVHP